MRREQSDCSFGGSLCLEYTTEEQVERQSIADVGTYHSFRTDWRMGVWIWQCPFNERRRIELIDVDIKCRRSSETVCDCHDCSLLWETIFLTEYKDTSQAIVSNMSSSPSLFTTTSLFSLLGVLVVGLTAYTGSKILLPKNASAKDRFTFIWLVNFLSIPCYAVLIINDLYQRLLTQWSISPLKGHSCTCPSSADKWTRVQDLSQSCVRPYLHYFWYLSILNPIS